MTDAGRMHDAMIAAGLPVISVQVVAGVVSATYTRALTAPEQVTAAGIIANPIYLVRVKRTLYSIYADLNALAGSDKVLVWNDLSAGTPKKYALSAGVNAGAISVLDWVVQFSGVNPTNIQQAQLRLIAMYVQDQPRYLEHPSFAPTINISGDQVA